jgi:hypothetical protein
MGQQSTGAAKLKWYIKETGRLLLDMTFDTIGFGFTMAKQTPVAIFILVIAVTIIGMSTFFIDSIPNLLSISGPLTIVIDVLVTVAKVFFLEVHVFLIGLHYIDPALVVPGVPHLDGITDAQFRAALIPLPTVCRLYNTPSKITIALSRLALNAETCPARRYVKPYPPIYRLGHVLQYTYFGSADPDLGIPGYNCKGEADIGLSDLICIGLNSGLIVLILLVLFIVAILIGSYRNSIRDLFKLSVMLIWDSLVYIEKSIARLLDWIGF